MEFFRETNINFVGIRKYGYIFSLILFVIAIASLILHGGPNYNIDFTGGLMVQFKFDKPIEIERMRAAVSQQGYGETEIKHIGSDREISIRLGLEQSSQEVVSILENTIRESIPENPFVVQRVELVGPKIGQEIIWDAIVAIILASLLILIYIMVRFEFRFSFPAVIALIHDSIITLGVFSVFNLEVSSQIVAAMLTIIGYSINDTIVVYDRIRENLKLNKNVTDLKALFNRSMNETLSRTVMTGVSTFIVLFVLFIWGGEVLRGFSLALLIGVFLGTYSSIFIASPMVLDWKMKKG
jgi:preprotein translocase SecF subunit